METRTRRIKELRGPRDLMMADGRVGEIRISVIHDGPITDETLPICDTPAKAALVFERMIVARGSGWDRETMGVLLLNSRRRVCGATFYDGVLDTLLAHPRETFRAAIIANAACIVLAHSHPSGDPTPSEADIRVTREMIRAGQLLKIELMDHVIVGAPAFRIEGQRGYSSLRELGYFF